jgi:hypothetical protein
MSDLFIFFSDTACKDRWKNIRTVFVHHLHDKTSFGLSAIKKHPCCLHNVVQFVTSHITKNGHQESNLAVPHAEDIASSGANEELG